MRAFFEAGALKPTHYIGDLPIDGEIYDEAVPEAWRLEQRDRTGERMIPLSCSHLFVAFHRLMMRRNGKGRVSAEQWINWIKFWIKRGLSYDPPKKRKGPGSEIQYPSGKLPANPPGWNQEERDLFRRLEVNDKMWAETYTAAFLACWLSTFVLPQNEDEAIRPGTFEVASQMAQGKTYSLAIPVLGSIYKGLNEIVMSTNPKSSKAFFPAHYLYGWLACYFNTYRKLTPAPPGPLMMAYSGAQGAKQFKSDMHSA